MANLAPRAQLHAAPPSHSIMEDASDTESDPDLDAHLDPDQQQFYQRQQEQAMYYQQHTSQHGSQTDLSAAARHSKADTGDDEEMYSDDDSSTASIPDDNINFELTYALHNFLATVEGQASVVKGDSLVLLDDANSYWWLVRVLKTEDVGYIPAENIETPYERLARLNKHRNVDLAMATQQEKQAGAIQGRDRLKGMIKARGKQMERSGSSEDSGSRRVIFAPPTYVDHPGVTWSSDEDSEDEGEEGDDEVEEIDDGVEGREGREPSYEGDDIDRSLDYDRSADMEPDDGVEWANEAAAAAQNPQRQVVQPKSNNPFARDRDQQPKENNPGQMVQSGSNSSLASTSSGHLDPAQAGDTRRITATPPVAQAASGPLLPSAIQTMNNGRSVSGQSTSSSVYSSVSTGSARSVTPTSPQQEDNGKKAKKMKKPSKEDLGDGEKRRSKGVLSGLFSRNKEKSKKGISSSDPRTSEESITSGAVESSPASLTRVSEEEVRHEPGQDQRNSQVPTGHGLRLQQRDQALQQAYTSKYLTKSGPSDVRPPTTSEAAIVAQNAAMRMASLNQAGGKRSSIILSPNPAGPPLLNVIRVFAGDHIKSDASFKTVLLNETTSATDLIRQLMQRFHLHGGLHGETGYYLTVKDVGGEEMELLADEKPLTAFQEAVQRWAADDEEPDSVLRAMTPTIKRSSVSSISSVVSLSSHPAIAKLGMNDFTDDSAVKIYLHRRQPGSTQQLGSHMPEPASEFSSYSTQLSAVQESSPEHQSSEWSTTGTPPSKGNVSDATASPPTPQPQPRYNPSLTILTTGQASPERFSSPSARFTVQLLVHPADLPDGSAFDPSSEAIIPRQMAKDRQSTGYPMDSRRRLFVLPRNATVVEAIEQGLERFGIHEGMVDGGDDVGNRGSLTRVPYALVARVDGKERHLSLSSKVLEAYATPPQLKPAERITPEQRRRSRDLSTNAGSASDILPTDPVFVLRRVQPRGPAAGGPMQRQQASAATSSASAVDGNNPLSPQEIIAAQRAATRANQKALISAHVNTNQGVDVVLPDRGTVRSSRLLVPDGEVVRYSYIDGDGETYDISEILEEELGKDGTRSSPNLAAPPALLRTPTDSSNYVTAPSTPDPEAARQLGERPRSQDILQGALERVGGQPDGKIEERLQRVINKVKSSGTAKSSTPDESATPTGRTTPQGRSLSMVPEGRAADATPRASDTRSGSRQANYQQTAASVNRIVSRHRQQPSIASIMSDFSASPAPESIREPASTSGSERHDDDPDSHRSGTRSSTPLTATTSSHPTPPFSGVGVFTRSVATASPRPRTPVTYTDDFGIKNLMAIVDVRSRDMRPKKSIKVETDEVEKDLYGEKIAWDGVHSDVRGIFGGVASRLDQFDKDVDALLASVLRTK